eukprot:g3637.t1
MPTNDEMKVEGKHSNKVYDFIANKRRMYTPTEVSYHNCAEDCWVSIFYKVYNLTDFLAANDGPLVQPIIEHAGQDISHWFDSTTNDIKTNIDPQTGINLPYMPFGRFIQAPPKMPTNDWRNDFGTPWWRNPNFCIGELSRKTQRIRVVNTLSSQETLLEVCTEETMAEILDRYLSYNKHAGSYTWKSLRNGQFSPMDMEKTLAENGVADESKEFERLSIDDDAYYGTVHLYFNDDLTVA